MRRKSSSPVSNPNRKEELQKSVKEFNTNPKEGMALILKTLKLAQNPENTAKVLLTTEGLHYRSVLLFLSLDCNVDVLHNYFGQMSFRRSDFIEKLKYLVSIKSVNYIENIDLLNTVLHGFSKAFTKQNPKKFQNERQAYDFALVILLLNSYFRYKNQLKITRKMFNTNVTYILDDSVLNQTGFKNIYQTISKNPFACSLDTFLTLNISHYEYRGILMRKGDTWKHFWECSYCALTRFGIYFLELDGSHRFDHPSGVIFLNDLTITKVNGTERCLCLESNVCDINYFGFKNKYAIKISGVRKMFFQAPDEQLFEIWYNKIKYFTELKQHHPNVSSNNDEILLNGIWRYIDKDADSVPLDLMDNDAKFTHQEQTKDAEIGSLSYANKRKQLAALAFRDSKKSSITDLKKSVAILAKEMRENGFFKDYDDETLRLMAISAKISAEQPAGTKELQIKLDEPFLKTLKNDCLHLKCCFIVDVLVGSGNAPEKFNGFNLFKESVMLHDGGTITNNDDDAFVRSLLTTDTTHPSPLKGILVNKNRNQNQATDENLSLKKGSTNGQRNTEHKLSQSPTSGVIFPGANVQSRGFELSQQQPYDQFQYSQKYVQQVQQQYPMHYSQQYSRQSLPQYPQQFPNQFQQQYQQGYFQQNVNQFSQQYPQQYLQQQQYTSGHTLRGAPDGVNIQNNGRRNTISARKIIQGDMNGEGSNVLSSSSVSPLRLNNHGNTVSAFANNNAVANNKKLQQVSQDTTAAFPNPSSVPVFITDNVIYNNEDPASDIRMPYLMNQGGHNAYANNKNARSSSSGNNRTSSVTGSNSSSNQAVFGSSSARSINSSAFSAVSSSNYAKSSESQSQGRSRSSDSVKSGSAVSSVNGQTGSKKNSVTSRSLTSGASTVDRRLSTNFNHLPVDNTSLTQVQNSRNYSSTGVPQTQRSRNSLSATAEPVLSSRLDGSRRSESFRPRSRLQTRYSLSKYDKPIRNNRTGSAKSDSIYSFIHNSPMLVGSARRFSATGVRSTNFRSTLRTASDYDGQMDSKRTTKSDVSVKKSIVRNVSPMPFDSSNTKRRGSSLAFEIADNKAKSQPSTARTENSNHVTFCFNNTADTESESKQDTFDFQSKVNYSDRELSVRERFENRRAILGRFGKY